MSSIRWESLSESERERYARRFRRLGCMSEGARATPRALRNAARCEANLYFDFQRLQSLHAVEIGQPPPVPQLGPPIIPPVPKPQPQPSSRPKPKAQPKQPSIQIDEEGYVGGAGAGGDYGGDEHDDEQKEEQKEEVGQQVGNRAGIFSEAERKQRVRQGLMKPLDDDSLELKTAWYNATAKRRQHVESGMPYFDVAPVYSKILPLNLIESALQVVSEANNVLANGDIDEAAEIILDDLGYTPIRRSEVSNDLQSIREASTTFDKAVYKKLPKRIRDALISTSAFSQRASLHRTFQGQRNGGTYLSKLRLMRSQFLQRYGKLSAKFPGAEWKVTSTDTVQSRPYDMIQDNIFLSDLVTKYGSYRVVKNKIPVHKASFQMKPTERFLRTPLGNKRMVFARSVAETLKEKLMSVIRTPKEQQIVGGRPVPKRASIGPEPMAIPTPNNDDLVMIRLFGLEIVRPDGSTYAAFIDIPAFHFNRFSVDEIAKMIVVEMDMILQSGTEIVYGGDFSPEGVVSTRSVMKEDSLRADFTLIMAPRAGTWSPRIDIENYFIKSTVRYIPKEVFVDNICIPVAILTAACRVISDMGEMIELEYESKRLGSNEDDCMFDIFDTREMSSSEYYNDPDKVEMLRAAAYALMDESNVEYEDITIESCEIFARTLNITIHVLYQENMCSRLTVYGDPSCKRNISILIRDEHAFPVMKPWRLTANCMPSQWCDKCHHTQSRKWSLEKMYHHRLQCGGNHKDYHDDKKKHGFEFIPKRYLALYNSRDREPLTAPFCRTCGIFCISAEIAKLRPDHQMENGISKFEDCMEKHHDVVDGVEMGKCMTCDVLLPIGWPDIADGPDEKYQYVNDHKCYIPNPELKIGDSTKYYVWDIETILFEGVHVPIYIYARSLYNSDISFEFETIDDFCRHVIQDEFKATTWIAHNSGGFDSNFVHSWLESNGVMHTRIPSPTSINRSLDTTIDQFDIRFIDSYNFIPMSLAKIGPAFNLPAVKGDFPHRFSSIKNLRYSGPMPPCDTEDDWYDLHGKRASSIEKADSLILKFKQWHAEESLKYVPNTDKPWVYEEQLRSYCKLDCDVLAAAVRILRDSFVEVDKSQITGEGFSRFCLCPVDPLCYLTMAQVCQQLYIAGLYESGNLLRIAHVPLADRKQHPKKTRWLQSIQEEIPSLWTANSHMREWIADDGLPVDGYARIGEERHIFEYIDCLERGCPRCTVSIDKNIHYGCTNRELNDRTVSRIASLVRLGYIVHTRNSHEDRDFEVHDRDHSMVELRQKNDGGFFGGRVEVFKPLWNAHEDEKIKYIDVVSLYPWVCATQRMCVGHPRIYRSSRIDRARLSKDHVRPYFGYAHVRVRGCSADYFGGLPRRDRDTDRLVFDNTEYTVVCFINELHERVENGMELLDVYEVWDFSDIGQSVEGPMSGYVSYFLRDKMECSGWRALCGREPETEEEKNAVCDSLEHENLGLCRPRPDKVADNPGGRQLAKLRLNMLWGKFVQTPRVTTSRFISTYDEYVKIWFDNQIDKSSLKFRRVNPYMDFMEVRYGYTSSARAPSNTHYYLGASCTAQARLKLTRMLRQVGKERALYCDTDSVVYVHREGDDEVETGEALGQWSSELEEGVWGTKFMALAPKCYMMLYNDEGKRKEKESAILKTKGVTLTSENLRQLNADNMEKIILTELFGDYTGDDKDFKVQARTFNIRMNLEGDREMINMHGEKVVQCVYTKRSVVIPDGADPHDVHFIDTTPFC